MGLKTEYIKCPHCAAQNTPSRDICFKCREPLHIHNGTAPPLPSVFNVSTKPTPWMTRISHEVTVPGALLGPDGAAREHILVREVANESLVFDSDNVHDPSEGVILEFTLEGQALHLDGTVRRTARTLGMEMAFATTVDLNEPGEEYLTALTAMNPMDDKEWWD